ncbi:MAG: hypothetical protein D6719_01655 [Candidatus Dadabacteria bacterium]|nr:MAG: hypothetical protein D6719_01655 [Candidatus Dadabacteria bacterium]
MTKCEDWKAHIEAQAEILLNRQEQIFARHGIKISRQRNDYLVYMLTHIRCTPASKIETLHSGWI